MSDQPKKSETNEPKKAETDKPKRTRRPSSEIDYQFVSNIAKRREQVKKSFAQNAAKLVDARSLKQVQVVDMVNDYFKANNIRDAKDDSKIREVANWEMSRWLLGRHPPSLDIIEAFAAVMEVEASDLVPGLYAEVDPHALTLNPKQLPDGNWLWEFSGTVGPETHKRLMIALSTPKE